MRVPRVRFTVEWVSVPPVRFTVRQMMVAVAIAGAICALVSLLGRAPSGHRVGPGENFWMIAKKHYGSSRYYMALWQANRDHVRRVDELYVGTTLRIPPREELDRSLTGMKGVTR